MAKKPAFHTTGVPDVHVEPIQASTVIVIHPGSMFLRIGRASDAFPHVVPHVIARRNMSGASPAHQDTLLIPFGGMTQEVINSMDEIQSAISAVLASCLTSTGKLRYSVPVHGVREHNMTVKPKILKPVSDMSWSRLADTQNVIIGEEVLYMNPNKNFNIHWPIRRGQFNLHPGVGGSLTSVLNDLETIWGSAIQQYLDIPLKELQFYRAVLVIPDVYNRQHVKELVNLLLKRLGFSCCFVHLESVCATFGAGLSCACVVDVGDQKTSVACVEDGISHRNTRLCMEYGGSDVSQLFYWLQLKCHFPYHFPENSALDALMLHELKETLCHVNLDVCGAQERSFTVKKPGVPVFQYNIKVGDECLIAPLALFHPELFGLTGAKKVRMLHRSNGDAEDPHDEMYLIQTQRRGVKDISEGPAEGQAAGEDNPLNTSMLEDEMDSTDPPQNISIKQEVEQDVLCDQLLGVDHAILQSIERCDCDELKRKMYSCILVIGGGMLFSGIYTWLQNRLSVQIPVMYRGEPIDIITRPKDMDPRITIWKGASVMCCLDTAQELWIYPKEWQRYSVKILRERAPFTW